MSENFSFVP